MSAFARELSLLLSDINQPTTWAEQAKGKT
jgi:hypothetical protein